jgi:ATP-binding cassette subfamily B (MDR/TAP) protein 1
VLNDATFFFPAGETTFLVGKSGSGKSTIANLLMKFYVAQSGEVFIDGQPIQSLDKDWLRQNITLVQQQAVLFNDTILQNIALGTREHTTQHHIRLAARDACLEHTIDEMPRGFDTIVGPKNRALSGGQGQRVAIARARVRDTPILILDESTSALDQTSRLEVMDKIRTWRRGKTTIIITHDVSQIRDEDYVYVLQKARVVQEGYCKTLAAKSHGAFAQFVRVAEASGVPSLQVPVMAVTSSPASTKGLEPHPQESHSRWDSISTILSPHDTLSTNSGRSMYPPRTRVSMGPAMLAQANALLAEEYWSSPVILADSPVKSSPRKSFMPFMSLVASPQIPAPTFQSSTNDNRQGTPTLGKNVSLVQRLSPAALDESRKELDAFVRSHSKGENRQDITLDSSLDQKPASLATVFRSVLPALAWKDRVFLSLGLFASVLVGVATPVFSWVFSQLLQTFYIAENRSKLAEKWALCMLAIALIDGTSCYCSHYFLEKTGQAWINSLRVESLRRILAQPKSWFDLEENAPSRLTECLDRDAEEMRNLLGRFLGLAITIFTMLCVTFTWAFAMEWKLTLVALASAPAMYAITRLYHWSSAKWEGKTDQACGVTSSIFSEAFSNIRVVRALTLENYFSRKHDIAIADGYKVGKTRAAVSGCMFGVTDSLIYYIVALVFYYGAVIVSSGDATVTRVFVVVNLLTLGTGNAIGMFAMIPQLNSSRTTATQVLRLANLPVNESHESQGTRRLADPFPIKFNNLSFTYPSRPHIKTLDNISLSITPGSCTAIVGPSGSGKSTVASLLLGLYPPDPLPGLYSPSTLTFAGKSSNHCNIHSIRSHMSIILQIPLLFPTTVFANIAYGLPETSPYNNYIAVSHAAMDAGIHDFISSLENGYNTLIGEGGMGLSGGQAQRIAIARALVRNPKVLILDEATSALDVETAEEIRDTVKRLRRDAGMAVVVISHNVDMMRIADTVVMIEDGKVVERGGFEELRKRGGAFESLITGDTRWGKVESEGVGLGEDMDVEEIITPVRPRVKMWKEGMQFDLQANVRPAV